MKEKTQDEASEPLFSTEKTQNEANEPLKESEEEIINISQKIGLMPSLNNDVAVEQIDQDKVQIKLEDLKIEFTSVSEVLQSTIVAKKDNYDLIKFSVKVNAVYEYSWEVYRRPIDIKKNFAEILKDFKKANKEPSIKEEIFTRMANMPENSMEIYKEEIENNYKALFEDPKIKDSLVFKEFFNISKGSFNQNNEGNKPFEGKIEKKFEPRRIRKIFGKNCNCICFNYYHSRWVALKDDSIYYTLKSDSVKGVPVLFDKDTIVNKTSKYKIRIINSSDSIFLKFKTFFEAELWYKELQKRINILKEIINKNRYQSYTNEKHGNLVKWFSDGEGYFKDLKENLLKAKEKIFITDWWLSPEVWLERPVQLNQFTPCIDNKTKKKDNTPNRLMDILYQCAEKGVKIFVLVFEEAFVLSLNSDHTEKTLEFHKNIIVTRHPSRNIDPWLLWSHHEKLVVIDEKIGYVGGLDLCWGRWDTNAHPIYEPQNDEENYFFPGIDYSNARICDFKNVEIYKTESVDRFKPRMPWHDVQIRIIGPAVNDIARHFIKRWTFSNIDIKEAISEVKPNSSVYDFKKGIKRLSSEEIEKNGKNQGEGLPRTSNILTEVKSQIVHKEEESNENEISTDKPEIIKGKTIIKKKKDITQKKGYQVLEAAREEFHKRNNFIDNNHYFPQKDEDENIEPNTNKTSRITLAQKIKNIRKYQQKEKTQPQISSHTSYNKLKKLFGDLLKKDKNENEKWFSKFINKIKNSEENPSLEKEIDVSFFEKGTKSRVQVLRSAGLWNCNLNKTETSIYNGYCQLIDNSKHYIYIENQFFISRAYSVNECERSDEYLYGAINNIAFHIRKRIEKAYYDQEKFRVFIFIPLLPGFEGNPEESSTLQIILKHTYAGICRNHDGMSIIQQLEKIMGNDWKNYIGFYSLRGHAVINNIPVTELIYIHSKLMIVDDRTVLIGSANINDRSMLGERDSEFAVIVNESKRAVTQMDGKEYRSADFAASFRRTLMAEHLGLEPNDERLIDPLSNELFQLIKETAKNNTLIYRKLFGCYPDDNYLTFDQQKKGYKESESLTEEEKDELRKNYEQEKKNIIGHIVEFPFHYLEKEELRIMFFSKEKLAPEISYI